MGSKVRGPRNSAPVPPLLKFTALPKFIDFADVALNVNGAERFHVLATELFVHAPLTVHDPPASDLR